PVVDDVGQRLLQLRCSGEIHLPRDADGGHAVSEVRSGELEFQPGSTYPNGSRSQTPSGQAEWATDRRTVIVVPGGPVSIDQASASASTMSSPRPPSRRRLRSILSVSRPPPLCTRSSAASRKSFASIRIWWR